MANAEDAAMDGELCSIIASDHWDRDQRRAFEYKSLGTKQIRLVRIVKIHGSDVYCELRHFDFYSAVDESYIALSYTWGDPAPTQNIVVNGQSFTVRQNLHDYLSHAHYYGIVGEQSRWLWIDQISIDQTNIDERNNQVPMMKNIYKECADVIIWLGSYNVEHAKPAMDFLNCILGGTNDLSHFLLNAESVTYNDISQKVARGRRTRKQVGHFRRTEDERKIQFELRSDVERSLTALLQNLYWTRVWIIQEVVLSKWPTLHWGPYVANWQAFKLCMLYFTVPSQPSPGLTVAQFKEKESKDWRWGRPPTLLEILDEFCNHECADPRDKVYALLAIAPSTHKIPVDYALDVEAVFAATAVRLLRVAEQFRGDEKGLAKWARVMGKLHLAMLPFQPFDETIFLQDFRARLNSYEPSLHSGSVESEIAFMRQVFGLA